MNPKYYYALAIICFADAVSEAWMDKPNIDILISWLFMVLWFIAAEIAMIRYKKDD